jgi:hypothetical protein
MLKVLGAGKVVGLSAVLLVLLAGCDIIIDPPITEYVLVVNVQGEGDVYNVPTGSKYSPDEVVKIKAVPEDGWEFSHWSGDAIGTDSQISVKMDRDKVITAVFEEIEEDIVELEVQPVGHGVVVLTPEGDRSEDGYLYERGQHVNLKAVAGVDWAFIGWFTTSATVISTANELDMILADDETTVVAKFAELAPPPPYDLTDARIYAQDDQFLGKVTTDPFEAVSLANPFGLYGDEYSSLSIWNWYGFYGSDYGNYSAYDPDAAHPPEIYLDGDMVGYLTKNHDFSPRYDPDDLAEAIGRYEVIRD